MLVKSIHYLIGFIFFLMPLAWWSRLNANYHSTKLILFFLLGGLCWIAISGRIKLLRLTNLMLVSLLTIVTIVIFKHSYRFSYEDFLYFCRILCFWGVAIYFYSSETKIEDLIKKNSLAILLTTSLILMISFVELFQLRVVSMSKSLGFLGTFGNVNMMAEYFILALPFVYFWLGIEEKIPKWFKALIFIFWIFFIFFLRSRSVWIGLGLWFLLLLWYKSTRKEWGYILVAFSLYLVYQWSPSKVESIAVPQIKEMNTQARLELYKASSMIIKDNPFGINVGEFISHVNPYLLATNYKPSEYHFYDNPHSDLLKWGIYYGWIYLIAVLVFVFLIVKQVLIWIRGRKNFLLVSLLVVLVPQLCFQFPFENPASTVLLSLVTALYFSQFKSELGIAVNYKFRTALILISICCLYSTVAFSYSIYNESTHPKTENIVEACDIYPIYNKACHAKMIYYIEKQKHLDFVLEFKEVIYRQPAFIDFIKLTPTYYSFQKNNKKTCESLFFYRSLFSEHKAFQTAYYENCSGFSDPFYFDNPKSFLGRYMNWLSDVR